MQFLSYQEQYVYLHDAVVHSLTFDSKPIPSEKFQDYLRCFTPEKVQKNYEVRYTLNPPSSPNLRSVNCKLRQIDN